MIAHCVLPDNNSIEEAYLVTMGYGLCFCLSVILNLAILPPGSQQGFDYFFQREGNCFLSQANFFKLNIFRRNLSSRLSQQVGKIFITAGQFAWCPALNETPELVLSCPYYVHVCVVGGLFVFFFCFIIFFKPVKIFQTGLNFSNQIVIFKPLIIFFCQLSNR